MPDPLGSLAFTWPFFAVFGAAYLVGSIPFGLLLTRAAGLGDIRDVGSGNIGATNVLRTGNRSIAALTLVLDSLKGALPVILANIYLSQDQAVVAGAGAFLGHLFPIWLRLKDSRSFVRAFAMLAYLVVVLGLLLVGKGLVTPIAILLLLTSGVVAWGGKGVATGIGTLLALDPVVGVLVCATWLVIAGVLRYSSLAALIAFSAAPVYSYFLSDVSIGDRFLSEPQRAEFAVFVAVLVVLRHLGNIQRLFRGGEPRIGGRRTDSSG